MNYGYYLTIGNQFAETRDHVNMLWLDDRRCSPDELASYTMQGKSCVIDVAGCLFNGKALRPDAEQRLRALREHIRVNGQLDAVHMLVPCDEPNLPKTAVAHLLPEATQIMQASWPGVLLGCIYYNDAKFPHMNLFDVVGFDDYDGEYGIFEKPRWWERIKLMFGKFVRRGSYLRFVKKLHPGQQTILMPGGAYGEDPGAWVIEAQQREEVWGVVPFLWASNADGNGIPGIRDLPVRAAYEAAGRALLRSLGQRTPGAGQGDFGGGS